MSRCRHFDCGSEILADGSGQLQRLNNYTRETGELVSVSAVDVPRNYSTPLLRGRRSRLLEQPVFAHKRHAHRDNQRRYSSGDAASRRGSMLTKGHTEATSHEINYRATMHSFT